MIFCYSRQVGSTWNPWDCRCPSKKKPRGGKVLFSRLIQRFLSLRDDLLHTEQKMHSFTRTSYEEPMS